MSLTSTGYVFEELYLWHNAGHMGGNYMEPVRHFEHPDTKRRIHSLLVVSGLLKRLVQIPAREASNAELLYVHDQEYIERIQSLSRLDGIHEIGVDCTMSMGGHDIAVLSAGGGLAAIEAVMDGYVKNAYALIRPPVRSISFLWCNAFM